MLRLGPSNPVVRLVVDLFARGQGFQVQFEATRITIRRGKQELRLKPDRLVLVPMAMDQFDLYFSELESRDQILDFSAPGLYRYKRTGEEFSFPAEPEHDELASCLSWYTVNDGDVVWDVGAHAGMMTTQFSRLVGPTGKVFAWEPDDATLPFLARNIAAHRLENVVIVRKALAGFCGQAVFNATGTQDSGIATYLTYTNPPKQRPVETITMEAACEEFGVPHFIKMDIEGAEVAAIEASLDVLRRHAIHLVIEPHLVRGQSTRRELERLLLATGYSVSSGEPLDQLHAMRAPTSA